MADQKLLTVFGATGNQGGSVIDVILANPNLKAKYKLRGVSRNASSHSAQQLAEKGVEMVSATLNDVESLNKAVSGSYGVFGVTNFWDKDVMSKDIEMRQGKNIFEACKKQGVVHYVFSTLPHAEKITDGVLRHIDHFDGKAIVADFIEENKGSMITSFFMPAMYAKSYKDQIRKADAGLDMVMPFVPQDQQRANWPVLEPRADSGKYVVGLLEGASSANGVRVHAVSAWTSPREFLASISKVASQELALKSVTPEALELALPETISKEITETMLLVDGYSYYGQGSDTQQAEHDAWLVKGQKLTGLETIIGNTGPWQFA